MSIGLWKIPDCSICYSPLLSDLCVLNTCGHVFHNQCAKKWFESKRIKCPCPLCRTTWTLRSLKKLNFQIDPIPLTIGMMDEVTSENLLSTLNTSIEAGKVTLTGFHRQVEELKKELEISRKQEAETATLLTDALASLSISKAQRDELTVEADRLRKQNQQRLRKAQQTRDELSLVKYLKQSCNDEEFGNLIKRFETTNDHRLFLTVLHNRLREENSVCESKETAKERWKQNALELKAANDQLITHCREQEMILENMKKDIRTLKLTLKRNTSKIPIPSNEASWMALSERTALQEAYTNNNNATLRRDRLLDSHNSLGFLTKYNDAHEDECVLQPRCLKNTEDEHFVTKNEITEPLPSVFCVTSRSKENEINKAICSKGPSVEAHEVKVDTPDVCMRMNENHHSDKMRDASNTAIVNGDPPDSGIAVTTTSPLIKSNRNCSTPVSSCGSGTWTHRPPYPSCHRGSEPGETTVLSSFGIREKGSPEHLTSSSVISQHVGLPTSDTVNTTPLSSGTSVTWQSLGLSSTHACTPSHLTSPGSATTFNELSLTTRVLRRRQSLQGTNSHDAVDQLRLALGIQCTTPKPDSSPRRNVASCSSVVMGTKKKKTVHTSKDIRYFFKS